MPEVTELVNSVVQSFFIILEASLCYLGIMSVLKVSAPETSSWLPFTIPFPFLLYLFIKQTNFIYLLSMSSRLGIFHIFILHLFFCGGGYIFLTQAII